MQTTLRLTAAATLLTLAACAQEPAPPPSLAEGEWRVDGAASELSYVTVKAGEIAEVNTFESLSGSVTAEGAASVEISLASVSTGIDIRDERMRDILFNVADNPTATVTAQLDPSAFATLAPGESVSQELAATLSLMGIDSPVTADVTITRVGEDRVLVVSDAPVIVYASAFELGDGLAQLQELASLPSITPAVPVSFSITFER